jgi:hypothetical protein
MTDDQNLTEYLKKAEIGSRGVVPFVYFTGIKFVNRESGCSVNIRFAVQPSRFPKEFPQTWNLLKEAGLTEDDLKRSSPRRMV